MLTINYGKKYLDTDLMQQTICITQLKFEKQHCFPVIKNTLSFSLPTQYNVENHKIAGTSFQN